MQTAKVTIDLSFQIGAIDPRLYGAFAEHLGCNPILLSGVDLAYTGKRRYAPGVTTEVLNIEEPQSSLHPVIKKKDRNGRPVLTAIRWLMESKAISHFAKMHPKTQFINTTAGGIGFKKIPYTPFEEVPFKPLPFSLRAKVHEVITSSPMPENTQEIILQKMEELKNSLDRIIS